MELISDNYKSRHCGQTTKPWSIITNSNFITIRFSSNYRNPYPGFVAIWSATTASPTYPLSTGCHSCTFPFMFGNTAFDSCISILDVDTQPWCSYNTTPPSNEGTHLFTPPKISCSDSDSSCPSTPPQMLITSPNYPQFYPNNADQVRSLNFSNNWHLRLFL